MILDENAVFFLIVRRVYSRIIIEWWFYALVGGLFFAQAIHNEVPGDLQVFYNTGVAVRNGINPWLPSVDTINFQFLNGPIFAFFCSILSNFGSRDMYLITCFADIVLAPCIINLSGRLFERKLSSKNNPFLSTFLIFTFPFRANVQYGQFVVVYVFLLLVVCTWLYSGKPSVLKDVGSGFCIIVLMDFKPHIFLIWLLILFRPRKYLVFGLSLGLMTEFLLLWIMTGTFLPTEWALRLTNRGTRSGGLSGFYNLKTLLSVLEIGTPWNWILIFLTVATLFGLSFRNLGSQKWAFVIFYSALFPASHPQDFIPFFVVALTFLYSNRISPIGYVAFGLSIVWSSNLLALLLEILILGILFLMSCEKRIGFQEFNNFMLIAIPNIVLMGGSFLRIPVDSYRLVCNIFAVLGVSFIITRNYTLSSSKTKF